MRHPVFLAAVLYAIGFGLDPWARAQTVDADRERGTEMLRDIEKELRKHYYDPTFRGIDLDALFKAASERVRSATAESQISGIIVKTLLDLGDSHTFFIPPPLSYEVDYGLAMQMIGEACYLVGVKPGGDPEAKGLKPGTRLLRVEGVVPTRKNMWQINYALNVARPRSELRLVVQTPGAQPEEKTVRARLSDQRRHQDFVEWMETLVEKHRSQRDSEVRSHELEDVAIAKLATFSVDAGLVDALMKKVRGRKVLILDLRDNSGGRITVLDRLIGYFFDHEVKVSDEKGRKQTKPEMARPQSPDRLFGGRLVVLVDSESASASEVFARVIQLEKRGTVIGDRSAGAVMTSIQRHYTQGHQYRFLLYGLSITESDVIMKDGASLEGVGVTPDELVLPTAEDLATGRDPALARAAELAGVTLAPEKAGTLFPREWP